MLTCQSKQLNGRARRLMRERGWLWPRPGRAWEGPDAVAEARLWSVDPGVVEWAQRHGIASTRWLIEDILVPDVVRMLAPDLQQLVDHCIVLKAAWTKRPQAVARHYRDEGVIVFVNGGLPLLLFDLMGHALALIHSEETAPGETRILIPDPPSLTRIGAVAALLVAFREAGAEFNLEHLPYEEGTGFGARSSLMKLVEGAERFVIGHELGHALAMLEMLPEPPGLRELLAPLELDPPNLKAWIEELTADVWALEVLHSAESGQNSGAATAVGCLLALECSHIVDWVFAIPSDLPFPPEPTHPDYREVFTPPADLRLHVATQVVEHWSRDLLQVAQPYRVAMALLLQGLQEASGGGCIAPIGQDASTLCTQPRAPYGWLCPQHAVLGR